MARISAYFLVIIILISNLPISQVCRIPVLLQHFQEHQQRTHGLGFMDFLTMHYGGDDMNDDDDDRDRELPFKKESILYSVYYLTPNKIQITIPSAPFVVIHCDINECFHQDAQPGSLFRPPKSSI